MEREKWRGEGGGGRGSGEGERRGGGRKGKRVETEGEEGEWRGETLNHGSVLSTGLGQSTPIPAYNVQTLQLPPLHLVT